MRIGSHEYANEADDDDDVPKPAQSLGTPVPRQKAPVRYLMKKLHEKQEEIIPSIEPPFCGRQLLKFINNVRLRPY